jgi:6-phospho-beta-glucosidase
MGANVVVVGGASTYTPELVEGLVGNADRFPVEQLVLLDIDTERLDVVAGLSKRILARGELPVAVVATDNRDRALDGADFVVVQLRVGGQAARLLDETLPLRFGCIGQETTGPGGMAKALRTVPVVLDIAEEAAERAAPGAWIIDFTNPVGIVTQSLLDQGHRAIGLCNVAIGLQRRVAAHLRADPERVTLEHVGLNHLSWERSVLVDGVDRLPELLDTWSSGIQEETGIPSELIRVLGAIPSYYLRYYYMTDEVLAEQRSAGHRPRAEEVMEIERELLELYRDPALDRKPDLLEQRGGAFYSEAATRLMASLHAGTADVQVVDVRNGATLPGLSPESVVEVPAAIESSGAHPLAAAPLPPELLGLVQQVKAYEHLAANAAITGSKSVALKALMANPLVGSYTVAAPLLDALLEANRVHLPRFFQGDADRATPLT